MDYGEFLKAKALVDVPTGMDVKDVDLNPMLFPFQHDIVRWALKRGRACLFADCGLGKTPIQLEWAHHVPGRVLIVAPLAVARQTEREGEKFHIPVKYRRGPVRKHDKITITNYEMAHHFDASQFAGVVLDESSILKSYTGHYRTQLIEQFAATPYKLAATATPAPNDFMEIGNHAEFMGVMNRVEMLAMFFVHDGGETQKWRLKGHAESEFWRWLCSWAVMMSKPSDLGYDDGDFILPPLHVHHDTVGAGQIKAGRLFVEDAQTLKERLTARRDTTQKRARKAASLITGDEPWLVWCNLNAEAEAMTKLIPGAVNVQGSMPAEEKAEKMLAFSSGKIPVLVTKPSIAGFGMNWQHCAKVIFLGLNDSWEQYYQAVRRCWRFGQEREVNVHIVTADIEGAVLANIQRKEKQARQMIERMVENMSELSKREVRGTTRDRATYEVKRKSGEGWEMVLGDSVELAAEMDADSVDYTIFSPPFASLYTYSNSDRDMGNCKDGEEFVNHFKFLITHLFRTLRPGRLLSFHCMNLPTSKVRDGVIGIRDFRGDLIRLFCDVGFIFHSEVCIWKNPVTAMQRTKALGLLHKQIVKDSCMSRQGIPDYLVTLRKPGENTKPVSGELTEYVGEKGTLKRTGRLSIDIWQRYASPVWMDINPSRVLDFRAARESEDERHICPLQLDVIERAMQLWTLEDDLVYSPFAGIGSEGFVAVETGRRFLGHELKQSYWRQGVGHLTRAQRRAGQTMELGLA